MLPVPTEELLSRYEPVTESGCWIWTGQIGPDGYARLNATRLSSIYAHRFFYEQYKGPIPYGLAIDHLCRVKCCVNPYHLEAVTQQVNILSGNNAAAENAAKTHCPQGHEYTKSNTYRIQQNGGVVRKCKVCHINSVNRYKIKRRGIMKAMLQVGAIFIAGLLAVGCSGGLSEVAMVIPDDKDGHHYIVNRDLVHDRVWANQHQLNGDFHCTKMRSSEEMAELRAVHGSNVVRYIHCTPLDTSAHPYAKNQLPGAGVVWLDSAKAVLYSATAAYVGHEIGKGIGKSGTTVNQQGGEANAENTTNSGNTSVKGNTSINSNNKNIMK